MFSSWTGTEAEAKACGCWKWSKWLMKRPKVAGPVGYIVQPWLESQKHISREKGSEYSPRLLENDDFFSFSCIIFEFHIVPYCSIKLFYFVMLWIVFQSLHFEIYSAIKSVHLSFLPFSLPSFLLLVEFYYRKKCYVDYIYVQSKARVLGKFLVLGGYELWQNAFQYR